MTIARPKPDRKTVTAFQRLGGEFFVVVIAGWDRSPASSIDVVRQFALRTKTPFHKTISRLRRGPTTVYFLPAIKLDAFQRWCQVTRAAGVDGNSYAPILARDASSSKLWRLGASVLPCKQLDKAA